MFLASAITGFGARAIETAAKFLLQFTIAGTLGSVGSGHIFLALSIANVACVIGRIGLDRSLSFRIATARALGQGALVKAQIATGLALCVFVSAALAAMLGIAASPMARLLFHDPGFAGTLGIMVASIPALAVLAMVVGILNGLERSGRAQLVGSAMWPALAAVLVLFARDVTAVAGVLLLSIVLATLAGLWMVGRHGWLSRHAIDREAARSLTVIGWPFLAVDAVQISLISMPTIVLGMLRDASEVGVFALANRVSLAMTIVMMVVGALGASRIAAAHALEDRARMQRVVRHLLLVSAAAALPVALALFVFAPVVLGLFGPEFAAGAGLLRWLLLGQVAGIVFTAAPNVLEMTGNGWRLRRTNLLALAVNVLCCVALIPTLGALGAALATTASLVGYNIMCVAMAWRHVRIHASPLALFYRDTPLIPPG